MLDIQVSGAEGVLAVLLSLVTSRGSQVLQNIPGLVLKVELMAVDILFSMTGKAAMVAMQFTVYSTRGMVSALHW